MLGEHFTGIIVAGIGIIIVVAVVLFSQAGVLDNATREMIQSEITDWGNTVVKNKEITQADVTQLEETLSSTGVICDVNMTLVVKDVNIGKKVSQTEQDKYGENATYEIHTTQIMDEIEKSGSYPIPSGATFTVTAENVSDSMLQTITNALFRSNNNNNGTMVGEYTVLVP